MGGDLGKKEIMRDKSNRSKRPVNGSSLSIQERKKLELQQKIKKGDLCCFNKKTILVAIPLDRLRHNLESENDLSESDLKYIYKNFIRPEKDRIMHYDNYWHKMDSAYAVIHDTEYAESYVQEIRKMYDAWPFRELFFMNCTTYDNEKIRESIKEYREKKKQVDKHKDKDYAKSEALVFEQFRKDAESEENIPCPIPMSSILYARIKTALMERMNEALNNRVNHISDDLKEPHLMLSIELDGLNFRIESMFTKLENKVIEETTPRIIATSTGQEISITPRIRYFSEGLNKSKIFNKDYYAFVEFIDEDETAHNKEHRSLGILPMCLIKKIP